jgi:hypothetical protein
VTPDALIFLDNGKFQSSASAISYKVVILLGGALIGLGFNPLRVQ